MKKKVLSLVLAFTLTLAFVPAFTTATHASENWRGAYAVFLRNQANYIPSGLESEDFTGFYFSLHDYDNDGIPELFVHLDWFTSPNDSVNVYTYKNNAVSFIDTFEGYLYIPDSNDFMGVFAYSGHFPYWDINYHEMINGNIRSTLVVDIEVSRLDDSVSEKPHHGVLYTEWKRIENSLTERSLGYHEITTANIEKYITSTGSRPSITTPSQTDRHFYATALDEFFEGATRFKAAFLIDGKVVAIKESGTPWTGWGYNRLILAVFAIENGENIKVEYGRGSNEFVGDFAGLSITENNYLYTGGEGGDHIIYEYNNGKLMVNTLLENIWERDVYEFNDTKISKKQYDEYVKKYGLDKADKIEIINTCLWRDADNDFAKEIAGILAMTTVPSAITVNPTASTVYVNGKATAFEAYLINGNNYFKLRDLAMAVNGSNKQFEIGYDNATRAITITSGQAYTPGGGEMAKGDSSAKIATLNSNINIAKDGTAVEVTTYLIDGNNFIKLRDVMKLFNIGVGYDNNTQVITIDTSKPYTD